MRTRVLGVDCGSNNTGYGIVDSDGYSSLVVVSGVIDASAKIPFPERLKIVSDGLRALIQSHSPHVMAVEDLFHSVNVNSLKKLAQVKGVVLLAAADAGIPVVEYSPLEVKSGVVGYGRAEKNQVQQMVQALLGLGHMPAEDAADALAVALCHAHRAQVVDKIMRAPSKTAPAARPMPRV